MTKLKNPVLSLGARGTLGDAITFQRRHGVNFVREKPKLPYFLTLPVQYQRWLYQDYAYLWTKQSLATKQEYATAGSRYHLTGFQYWMKYQLTNLPGIAGWWKLDEPRGAIVYDSGRQAVNATIVGATPATGVIDRAYYLDGINDRFHTDNTSLLAIEDNLTILAFISFIDQAGDIAGFGIGAAPNRAWLFRRLLNERLMFDWSEDGTVATSKSQTSTITCPTGWHLVALTFASGVITFHVDTTSETFDQSPSVIHTPTRRLYIGYSAWGGLWSKGWLDNFILYSRVLDNTEIARWAGRSYPAQ